MAEQNSVQQLTEALPVLEELFSREESVLQQVSSAEWLRLSHLLQHIEEHLFALLPDEEYYGEEKLS